MRPDIEYAVEILSKLSESSDKERLANGGRLRQEIVEALAKNNTPMGYRWEWLVDCSKQLMDLLKIMADDFNKAHPSDMASSMDMLDILSLTQTNIKNLVLAKKKVDDPEEK